jgi:DNA repair exonuclease SbcCD ATPase subunit
MQLMGKQNTISRQLRDLTRRLTEVNSQARSAHAYVTDIDAEIERLKARGNVETSEADVEAAQREVDKIGAERDRLDRQARTMGAGGQMLKDGGVKTAIIREKIPEMNSLINENLSKMDLMVGFYLDENFNEIIRSRHRDDFTYEMFSAGEKMRIDLAILFTWREIARRRTGASINLLVFDEILDSSLDDQGIDDFLKMLRDLTRGQSVFIISHKREQLSDKFDRTLRFAKRNGFSKIEEVN